MTADDALRAAAPRARRGTIERNRDEIAARFARGEQAAAVAAAYGFPLLSFYRACGRVGIAVPRTKRPAGHMPPPDVLDKIRTDWAAGRPAVDIAREHGYCPRAFLRLQERFGLPPRERRRRNDWSRGDLARLRELRAGGATIAELAAEFGRSVDGTRNAIRRYCRHVTPRAPVQSQPARAAPEARRIFAGHRNGDAVFVSMPPAGPFESSSAAEKLDSRVERAREAIRKGGAPNRVARSFNVPLRVAYQLAGEVRREREEA